MEHLTIQNQNSVLDQKVKESKPIINSKKLKNKKKFKDYFANTLTVNKMLLIPLVLVKHKNYIVNLNLLLVKETMDEVYTCSSLLLHARLSARPSQLLMLFTSPDARLQTRLTLVLSAVRRRSHYKSVNSHRQRALPPPQSLPTFTRSTVVAVEWLSRQHRVATT